MDSTRLVSLHPHVLGDAFIRLSPGKIFSGHEIDLLSRAGAVVVPQNVKAWQYREIASLCPRVFPDYRNRFGFEGKCGNLALFEKFGLPHPETRAYGNAEDFQTAHPKRPPFGFPFVMKADRGGGGNGVFLIGNDEDLKAALALLGSRPFVAQKFVDHQGADLRVVILGDALYPYWRVQDDRTEFRNNVGRGARISHDFEPGLTDLGIRAAAMLGTRAGIDCAAVDVLFDRGSKAPKALLGEVNFVFGRKGMGGTNRFRELFRQAVNRWTR
ncbi:MAG: hypothetical protein HZB23_15605 [Deltaproteobacteria bacterium]|nr:hypothetical protein [Deltaproteobacteria bacterium]